MASPPGISSRTPPGISSGPVSVPSALLLDLSYPCTVRPAAHLALSLHGPPNISSGPVPARSARDLVWSYPCTVRPAARLVLFMLGLCSCLPCLVPVWSAFSLVLVLSLHGPPNISSGPVPVPSAILLGLVLTCTVGFDGPCPCLPGPVRARSALMLALSCPCTVRALARLALSLDDLCSCLLRLASARSALLLVPSMYRPSGFSSGPFPARSARLFVWSCPCTVRALACLVLSLLGPRSCPSNLIPARPLSKSPNFVPAWSAVNLFLFCSHVLCSLACLALTSVQSGSWAS